jgi:hypothetical protein
MRPRSPPSRLLRLVVRQIRRGSRPCESLRESASFHVLPHLVRDRAHNCIVSIWTGEMLAEHRGESRARFIVRVEEPWGRGSRGGLKVRYLATGVLLALSYVGPCAMAGRAHGYAEAHPVASNDTGEGRAQNRRVVSAPNRLRSCALTSDGGSIVLQCWPAGQFRGQRAFTMRRWKTHDEVRR